MGKLKQTVYGLVILLIGVGTLHAADLKDGFLGIKWRTPISELPDFVKVSEKYGVSYYGHPKKSYTIFGVENPSVIYGFYEEKFFAAYIQVESIEVFSRVKDHITQKFGSPQTILKMQTRQTIYRWKHEDTRIKLKLYEQEGRMKLSFYYTPLAAKVNRTQRGAFPQVPQTTFSLDSRSRQQVIDNRRLQQAIDVMGF